MMWYETSEDLVEAVSYTHLDVYKRQRNTFPALRKNIKGEKKEGGKYQVRLKTTLEGTVLEQVCEFNYLGCVGYETERDVATKLSEFQMMCAIVHRTLKNKTKKDTGIRQWQRLWVGIVGAYK